MTFPAVFSVGITAVTSGKQAKKVGGYIDRQQGDLISHLLFLQNKEGKLSSVALLRKRTIPTE
jgi:hypothetical protein